MKCPVHACGEEHCNHVEFMEHLIDAHGCAVYAAMLEAKRQGPKGPGSVGKWNEFLDAEWQELNETAQ